MPPTATVPKPGLLLEICTASLEDCQTAEAAGADRLELNSALFLGGLTPSLGLLQAVKQACRTPVIAMVRPRHGGFCYSEGDLAVMERDLELAAAHGADGLAFGVLTATGAVDLPACRRLLKACHGRPAVFHRAFDVTPEPFESLEALIDVGFVRVMTSGQQATAYQGAERIAGLIERAAGRIEILPAGGIDRFSVRDVVDRTGCTQVHASLRTGRQDTSAAGRPQVTFGGSLRPAETTYEATDALAVEGLKRLLTMG